MSMGDFNNSSPGSDDDILRETEDGDGEPTGRAPSEASYVGPLIEGHHSTDQEQQQSSNSSFPRQLFADIARNATSLFSQSSADQLSLGRFPPASLGSRQILPTFTPTDRALPAREVTDETLDDAYVTFILYCNPSVPLDCDTTELRKAFRLPPKSDGKTFNVYELLQLIMRLEQKEIKTWTKLAIELGVERTPDQSAQKVQQYAVRLKRWMHAMHIDAFFEYCLGKAHSYYIQIPQAGPEEIRDGVPLEEDLALRALHPENRPKRGRRKTEDRNDENSERDIPASKRQQIDSSTPTTADAVSAMEHFHSSLFPGPHSAVGPGPDADSMERYIGGEVTPDPWSATAAAISGVGGSSNGQQFRWRAFSKEATTPHPSSAPILSLDTPTDEIMTPTITTPMSAKPRSRRRHGPAVSSAWPSSGNPLTGKLRGRPPSNRSVRDGPFSTFPVNPSGKSSVSIDLGAGATGTPTSTPIVTSNPQQFPLIQQSSRPSGLHLQVPPRKHSTVTMASPVAPRQINGANMLKPDSAVEDLERVFAANLLQGSMVDLSIDDVKNIARKAISNLRRMSREGLPISEMSALSTLKLLLGCETNSSALFKDFKIEKIPTLRGSGSMLRSVEDGSATLDRFKLSWRIEIGSLKGDFSQVVRLGMVSGKFGQNGDLMGTDEEEEEVEGENDDDERAYDRFDFPSGNTTSRGGRENRRDGIDNGRDPSGNEFDWRRKYFEMEKRLREKENEIATIKRKVLHAVM